MVLSTTGGCVLITILISYTDLPLPRRRRQAYADVLRHSHNNIQGTSIEERPKSVGTRAEFGHWEGDLIVGTRGTRTVCLTLLERKTRYVVATLLPTRHAAGVVRAIDNLEAMLKDRFSDVFKSITFDNGSEFSDFKSIERSCADASRTRTKVYYAHPYRSGERGSNENANGLLRRAGLRKGKDLGKIPAKVFDRAVRWVNELPRSIFYYAPALEMFEAEIGMQLIL
ncbi:IS30 family transposase [Collinsella sp. AGMB00827]|uniref:IS30 family transposase n=1 Tax=Collinsella ureilytica TaxID=2869515 RepID=A0ABS7MLP1_9ACTN|nr:IS30 family transposase [Collinsella urealyticum]MBY4798279.1 IS30 family transposase [Collinsella urealyticum]